MSYIKGLEQLLNESKILQHLIWQVKCTLLYCIITSSIVSSRIKITDYKHIIVSNLCLQNTCTLEMAGLSQKVTKHVVRFCRRWRNPSSLAEWFKLFQQIIDIGVKIVIFSGGRVKSVQQQTKPDKVLCILYWECTVILHTAPM